MIPYLALLFAALTTYLLVPPTIVFAKRYGLVTHKKKRHHPAHTHTGVIPRAGGLAIFGGVLAASLWFLYPSQIVISILIASALIVFLGLADDYFDLSPYWRFAANIGIASIIVFSGLGIPYISNPFGGVFHLDTWVISYHFFGPREILVWADIFAIFWLVWTMNMVNWSKGVDGQLPGFVAITAFFLGLLSQRFIGHDISTSNVMTLAFITAGAFLGFLPYNFFPQKIMPGYGGGALAGMLLGSLSILSFGKLGTALLILAIPMIDAVYTIVRRINAGHSPFRADWGHFHHKLLEIGWGKRRIAVFYWLISFILGLASLFFDGGRKLAAFITMGILLMAFIIIIERMKHIYHYPDGK